jgi:hypothetical protein
MRRQDARKLDHATLEAIRIRAVQQVQAGESPEAVIGALGFSSRCIYSWLANCIPKVVALGKLRAPQPLFCPTPIQFPARFRQLEQVVHCRQQFGIVPGLG